MGKISQRDLLSWGNLLSWKFGALVMLAVIIMLIVALRPRMFWPLLIAVNIYGVGPRVGGYLILDEVCTSFVVFGALMRLAVMGRSATAVSTPKQGQHRVIFFALMAYLVVESAIGVVVNHDTRLVRFVWFFIVLALLSAILAKEKAFPFPDSRRLSGIITINVLIYFAIYIGQGIYYQHLLGNYGRFLSQDSIWSGSSYAVGPMLIGIPAALLLLRDRSRALRLCAWLTIVVMVAVAIYFDVRIAYMQLIAFSLVSLKRVRLSAILSIVLVFVVAFALFASRDNTKTLGGNLSEFGGELGNTVTILWHPQGNDVARDLQAKAGFLAWTNDWHRFIFGSGYYSSRFVIIPFIERAYRERLPQHSMQSMIPGTRDDSGALNIFRGTALPALMIDTGLIGMLLLGSVMFLSIRTIRLRGRRSILLWMPILFVGAWFFVDNNLQMMLIWILMMPHGLLERWAASSSLEEGASSKPLRAARQTGAQFSPTLRAPHGLQPS